MKKPVLLLVALLLCAVLSACNPYENYIAPEDLGIGSETAVQSAVLHESDPAERCSRTIASKNWKADVWSSTSEYGGFSLETRRYSLSDESTVTMRRLRGCGSQQLLFSIGKSCGGKLYLYDKESGIWTDSALENAQIQALFAYLEFEDGSSMFVLLPKAFAEMHNGVLEYLPEQDGSLVIRGDDTHRSFDVMSSSADSQTIHDCLIQYSPKKLLNVNKDSFATCWAEYADGTEALWCYDGYYRAVPSDYSPNGENAYYRCVASYLPRTLTEIPNVQADDISILIAMMDTIALQQNALGYWATAPSSNWLVRDFSISPGFFDTRFNADLTNLFIKMDELFGKGLFDSVIDRYVAFYQTMANGNHTETESGGWLIEDYWCESKHLPTHTSLNHQAAECLMLYHLSEHYLRPNNTPLNATKEYQTASNMISLGNLLLRAIDDTADEWIMEDSNLYYSRSQDGIYNDGDYPRLTYTDLFYLQEFLADKSGKRNEALDLLMGAKRTWMDNNNIENYLK